MRGIDIGQLARSGKYCDICEKVIYVDVWGHIAMHKQELQQAEDARASREASEKFKRAVNPRGIKR